MGKGGLFVVPPLEDGLTGLAALLPKLEQVVPIQLHDPTLFYSGNTELGGYLKLYLQSVVYLMACFVIHGERKRLHSKCHPIYFIPE